MSVAPVTRPINASMRVPGSKSLSNRHLLLAAVRAGRPRGAATTLKGFLRCDDTEHLIAALASLGTRARWSGEDLMVDATPAGSGKILNLGDGGTPTRFMLAYAASCAHSCRDWITVDGSARMRERPIAEGVAMLQALGARVEWIEAEGRLPVRVLGGSLLGGALEVGRTASSQFVSALLLVAPTLERGLELKFVGEPTSATYLELSLAALVQAGFGAPLTVERDGSANGGTLRAIRFRRDASSNGATEDSALVLSIEPDASSAVYPAAAAVLTGGSVVLEGLPRLSAQPDRIFLEDLAFRGARLETQTEVRPSAGHAESTRVVAQGALRGRDSDYSKAPDAAVMAMVLAACGSEPSLFTGLGTLRVKESDRIAAVAAGLRALGGTVETGDDWARVHPLGQAPVAAAIETVQDHRIAMAFAVLGLVRPGVSIRNPSCVAKSWPRFWTALQQLRTHP